MTKPSKQSSELTLIKDLTILNLDNLLIEIVLDVEIRFVPGVCTSAYRPEDAGKGKVHGTMPVRGYDRRCRDQLMGDKMAAYINARWMYDPKRPKKRVAKCHDTGRGLHLHFQVHPNTIKVAM